MASSREDQADEVNYHRSRHNSDQDDSTGNQSSSSGRERRRSRSPRSRSRTPPRRRHSRERRRSREKDRRRHYDSSKYSTRRCSPERSKHDDRRHKHSNYHRRDTGSRSASQERHDREHERSKMELRQQMARNYEEQLEKMRSNQFGPPNMPNAKSSNQGTDPSKLVEQIEKRKFLFKKDKPADTGSSTSMWKKAAFSDDSDGKMTAKFKRLMGMKESDAAAENSKELDPDTVQKQSEYFANLEKQYEVARATTHTQRGLGLGFSSRSTLLQPKP